MKGTTYFVELEVDSRRACRIRLFSDHLSQATRAAEVRADAGLEGRFPTREISSTFNGSSQVGVDGLPVRPAEHGASSQESQGVELGSCVVDSNVPEHIFANLLSEVDVDTEEVG